MLWPMRAMLLLAGLALAAAAQSQEIYRWVDKDGVVHYADQPGAPDAKAVDLPGLSTYRAEPAAEVPTETPEPAASYQSLRIVSPTPEQVFFGADASVPVELESVGPIEPGHLVTVYVNGQRADAFPADSMSGELTGLARGTHFLRAEIVDGNARVLVRSEQVMFHVRQASIANPPVGPRLRPPPPKPPKKSGGP